jgi:hypothetical protein
LSRDALSSQAEVRVQVNGIKGQKINSPRFENAESI